MKNLYPLIAAGAQYFFLDEKVFKKSRQNQSSLPAIPTRDFAELAVPAIGIGLHFIAKGIRKSKKGIEAISVEK